MRSQLAICAYALVAALLIRSGEAGLTQRRYRDVDSPVVAVEQPASAVVPVEQIPVVVIGVEKEAVVESHPSVRRAELSELPPVAEQALLLAEPAPIAAAEPALLKAEPAEQSLLLAEPAPIAAEPALLKAEPAEQSLLLAEPAARTAEEIPAPAAAPLDKELPKKDEAKDAAALPLDKEMPTKDEAKEAAPLKSLEQEKSSDLPKPAAEIAEEKKELEQEKEKEKLKDKEPAEAELPSLRQASATVPTPTQTTTQQNFVQFLQNSPIGQFFGQLTGQNQQQQQQQQQAAGGQVAADEPATPQPTIPGFLNPSAAITNAQQAVQNAAQTLINNTQQAFQGIQQFATNVGSQFQNTLSSLGGLNQQQQQQQVQADSTTQRPAGPLQGIINLLQGNNRPQGGQAAAPAPVPAQPIQPLVAQTQSALPAQPQQPAAASAETAQPPAAIDDKIDETKRKDELQLAEASGVDAPEPATADVENTNQLRNSNEVSDDSFEDPDNVIVVDDDAGEASVRAVGGVVVPKKVVAVVPKEVVPVVPVVDTVPAEVPVEVANVVA